MSEWILESRWLDLLVRGLGPGAPTRGLVLAAATLVILVYLHRASRARLAAYVQRRAYKKENAANFLRAYDATWKVGIGIVVLVAAAGSFALLGLSVGVLGTMLGWALQTPIRGLAAWVMVVLGKPFRLGDRIQVAGVTGDVTDIQLNHIVLNQVGGTVSGEEASGRGILVPTAMLFGEQVINYHLFGHAPEAEEPPAPMLDEVPVRVTFGSDYERAKRLCIEAARQATAELIGPTDEEPFTRTEFLPTGVLLRVRYHTVPARRQEVASRVTELIWQAFRRHARHVRFRAPVSDQTVLAEPDRAAPPMFRASRRPKENDSPRSGRRPS